MTVHMQGKRATFSAGQQGQHLAQTVRPRHGGRVPGLSGPSQQIGRHGKGRATPAQFQLQPPGELQMVAARSTRPGQGMFQQYQQHIRRHRPAHARRHMAQQPPGGRQGQGTARRIVRHNAPPGQHRRHPPRQAAVRRDQRRPLPPLQCTAQGYGNRRRLLPRGRCLNQGQVLGGLGQVGQQLPLDQPGIRHRRGPQRQRDQAVAIGVHRRRVAPWAKACGRHPKPIHQPTKAELRVILGCHGVVHAGPDGTRHLRVKPRHHHGPLRQPGNRLHQRRRRAA